LQKKSANPIEYYIFSGFFKPELISQKYPPSCYVLQHHGV